MRRYRMLFKQRATLHRSIEVVAKNRRAAIRAGKLLASDQVEANEGEDSGEWCDSIIGPVMLSEVDELGVGHRASDGCWVDCEPGPACGCQSCRSGR